MFTIVCLFICLFVLSMSSQKSFLEVIPDIKFSAQIMIAILG